MTKELYIVLGFLIVYIISLLYTKFWISKAYKPDGVWGNTEPDTVDVFVTLFPLFNTIHAIICLFVTPNKKIKENRKNRAKKFFKYEKK